MWQPPLRLDSFWDHFRIIYPPLGAHTGACAAPLRFALREEAMELETTMNMALLAYRKKLSKRELASLQT